MPQLSDKTRRQQELLAAYARDGEAREIEGVTPGRIPHYRRLVFNVVRDALTSTYPLTVNLLIEKEWSILCQEFFAEHTCSDPQVWRMPEELIGYVAKSQTALCSSYPHLLDLLLLEWKEVEYYMMPDRIFEEKQTADPLHESWNLNPESEVVRFRYPVHLKNARYISRTDEGEFYCLIFRQPVSSKVKFMNLSPFLAWLMETLLQEPGLAPYELLPLIQEPYGSMDENTFAAQLTSFFEKLTEDGMVR